MLKSNYNIVFLLFAPLFIFFFNQYNQILANADGQHYLHIALNQYQIFQEQGFFEGIKGLYTARSEGLRPLLYPVYITFFMLLANGDMYLTTSLVMASIAGIWTLFAYKLISLSGNKILAIFTSVVIVIWPGFSYYHYNMFSETTHIALLFAAIYYIIKSNYFQDRSFIIKAGIFAGLVICVRPELLFIVPFGLVFICYNYFKINKNFFSELLVSLSLFLAFLSSLYASFLVNISPYTDCAHCISNNFRGENESIFHILFFIFVMLIFSLYIIYRNQKRQGRPLNFSLFLFIIFSISLLWYFPYADQLFEWFRVGIYNLQDYNNPVADFRENWNIIYPNWITLFIFGAIILSLKLVYNFKNKVKLRETFFSDSSQLLIIGLSISFIYIVLLIGENAGITPLRRTAPAIFLLIAGIFSFCKIDNPSNFRFLTNCTAVSFYFIVCFSALAAFYPNNDSLSNYVQRKFNIPWQHTIYAGEPKPLYNFVKKVSENVDKNKLQQSRISIPGFTHWPPDITHGVYLHIDQLKIDKEFNLRMWMLGKGNLTLDDQRKNNQTHILIDTMPEFSDEIVEKKIGFHFYPGWQVLKKLRAGDLQGMKEIDRIYVNKREYILYEL